MPDPILLRRTCQETNGQYTQVSDYWDDGAFTVRTVTEETFECSPFELPVNSQIGKLCGPNPDPTALYGTLLVFRYAGNGEISVDEPVYNSPSCPRGCDLTVAQPSATLVEGNPKQWRLELYANSSVYPITFTLPGQNPQAIPAPNNFGSAYASFLVPLNGTYTVAVEDGAGCNTLAPTITTRDPALGGIGDTDDELQLKWTVFELVETNDQTGEILGITYERRGSFYRLSTREVVEYVIVTDERERGLFFSRNIREQIDKYTLPDGRTLRRVYHDGNGGIRFEETVPATDVLIGELTLLNYIKTDIDEAGTQTGRLWLEAETPAPPIRYQVGDLVNNTGQFNRLAEGEYPVTLSDAAGRSLSLTIEIEDRYRPRWVLPVDDLEGNTLRVTILEQGFTGAVETICGGAEPVQRGQEGAGNDPEGAFPEVIGQQVTLTLRTERAKQFADLSLRDDRQHRVDIHRASTNELVFRGYVAPETYREPLLAPGQEVTVMASDGLGPLDTIEFLNHEAKPMRGRRPLLSTILHCLSRCDVNLPLYVAGNLRETTMSQVAEPLLEAWAHRTAYGTDELKPPTCREVLEAILRPFFLQLCQRNGAWWLEAIPEIDGQPVRRGFTGEGLPMPAPVIVEPFHILPPGMVESDHDLFWIEAGQVLELTPPAAVVQATVKLQLEESLLENSDFQAWAADESRPLNWTPIGGIVAMRVNAEKAKRYWLELRSVLPGSITGLLSSPVRLLSGQDLSPMRLSISAFTPAQTSYPGGPVPEKRVVRLPVELSVDGVPVGDILNFEFESAAKMSTQETLLPAGLGEGQLRVKLLPPELLSGPASSTADPVRVLVEYIRLAVIPAARSWGDQDQFTAINQRRGYYQLPPVELVHADIPRLALANGLPAPISQMDVDAWRHALSLAPRTATVEWVRRLSNGITPLSLPLLETAAVERMDLRTVPGVGMTGTVRGPGVWRLGVGCMVDAPYDEDGRFLVVSCQHDERSMHATIVVRRLAVGSYITAPELEGRIRYSSLGPRYTSLNSYRTVSE
ncbi:hypothetical protein [Hymenobacter fodinae]|uniref:Uncharacterized protein n=1 Tax=Hymenobacter fodinae TaxID=2510796 RepID=A0A4Z0P353_9BACT|nr:hypothetical protein [Hymenobacter fodinae]TGE05549.1 hypothetical protein EU556_19815 [Hymenobacter fodinae]